MRCRDGTDGEQTCAKNEQVKLSPILSEKDFYPPQDNRYWQSGVDDIQGGDNFAEYAEEYYRLCEDEERW